MRSYLEQERDYESARFLLVLEGLLQHTVLKEAEKLEGMYSRAADRIFNQVSCCHPTIALDRLLLGQAQAAEQMAVLQIAGSDWKLVEEGKSAETGSNEPEFSTWDEVLSGKQKSQPSSSSPRDMAFYK